MKIIDGIKEKGKKVEIPNASRDDLPEFFKGMGFKVGAEIGVYKGDFTKKLAAHGAKIFGIDPWQAYGAYHDKNYKSFQDRQDFLYKHSQYAVRNFPNVTLIRKKSMDAVEDFADESLDFVYIDGHHGFRYVADDIWEWSRKVRVGGVVAGHDYAKGRKGPRDPYTLHVKHVVDAYTEACFIDNWYLIGSEIKVEGEKRDNWRSWFWIKE